MKEFIQSPNAANITKDSDVTVSDWPVVTRSLVSDHEKLIATHKPEEVNQSIFSLIRARKAINDAMISVSHAARLNGAKATQERLKAIVESLKSELDRFPLTVLENAGNRPRRHIMAGHDSVDRPTPWGVE